MIKVTMLFERTALYKFNITLNSNNLFQPFKQAAITIRNKNGELSK